MLGPDRRLFHVHPALPGHIQPPGDGAKIGHNDLPEDWRKLDPDEQDDREAEFFRRIFTVMSRSGRASFTVDLPLDEDRQTFRRAVAGAADVDESPDGTFSGALTEDVCDSIVRLNPAELRVVVDGEDRFYLADSWLGAYVYLTETEARDFA